MPLHNSSEMRKNSFKFQRYNGSKRAKLATESLKAPISAVFAIATKKGLAFYALATIPLARRCKVDLKGESWFADDASGGAHPRRLRQWWNNLVNFGRSYGYFVNGKKDLADCERGPP